MEEGEEVLTLRPYQSLAVEKLYDSLRNSDGNPVIVIPTGGGKTPVMAQVAKDAIETWGGRVLILAHRRELLIQNARMAELFGPRVGIYSAGLKSRETQGPLLVAGIQSVYRRACELGRFDLVLVDEAHLIPPEGEGMYRTFLQEAETVNPEIRVIGLTATPYRMTSGFIYGPEEILSHIAYEVGVKELIVDGYLCRLISKSGSPESIPDTSGVHTRGGEFIASELEAAMSDSGKVHAAVRETLALCENRRKVLVFSCGISHAEMIVGAFWDCGIPAAVVTSETPADERETLLEEFRCGSLRFLVNVNILTEGFDAPNIDAVILMRATKSPGLYYQMVGRGLRLSPGKENCLVLDFGENVLRHGPVDKVRISKQPSGSGGEAPAKMCPECREMVPTAVMACPSCGFEFPPKELARHGEQAGDLPVLSAETSLTWHEVSSVSYYVHRKAGAPDDHPRTLRVEYHIGFMEKFSEWICLEHPSGSFANGKASAWWMRRTDLPVPEDVELAVEIGRAGMLLAPSEIRVKVTSGERFPRIVGYRLPNLPDHSQENVETIRRAFTPEKEAPIPF